MSECGWILGEATTTELSGMDTVSSLSTSKGPYTGTMGLGGMFHGVQSVAEGDTTSFSTSSCVDTLLELDSTGHGRGWTGAIHIGAGAESNSTSKE